MKQMQLDLNYFENILAYKSIFDEKYLTSIIDYINPEYFHSKDIKSVMEIITHFHENRGKPPSPTEIKAYLTTPEQTRAFKKVISSFKDLDKNFNEDEVINNTQRWFRARGVTESILKFAKAMSDGDEAYEKYADEMAEKIGINLTTDMGLDLFNDIGRFIEDLDVEQKTISTGWEWLDDHLDGGFLENGRSLYVFAGETNIGKSIFLGNIATNIAKQGKTVLLLSFEMSEMMYAKRLCSNVTRIPIRELRDQKKTLEAQIKQIKEENPGGNIIIKEFPPSTCTPNQIRAFISKLESSGVEIDAVVLDYLNLLNSPMGDGSYERILHVTHQVRALSYIFNCPFITATQLNRSGYGTESPGLDTISESMGLPAAADVVVSLWRNEEDEQLGIIRSAIMKNRFGPRGVVNAFSCDYSTLTILQDEALREAMQAEIEQDELNAASIIAAA